MNFQTEKQKAYAKELVAQRITAELGLKTAALLPDHEQAIGKIADTIGVSTNSRPLTTCGDSVFQKVKPLLEKLPATKEVRAMREWEAPPLHAV